MALRHSRQPDLQGDRMSDDAAATGRLADLAARLGHRFADPSLLEQALTHASAPGQRKVRVSERLEFLGDRVIGLTMAELLIARFPAEPEGALAKRQAHLVRRDSLAEVARGLGLGALLTLAEGQGTRDNATILGDAMEAVLGALYLDGGLPAARRFVAAHWGARIEETAGAPPQDSKTRLQEWSQGAGRGLPVYEVMERSGPDHAPRFRVAVLLGGDYVGEGLGGSKREAETAAAEAVLAFVAARRSV